MNLSFHPQKALSKISSGKGRVVSFRGSSGAASATMLVVIPLLILIAELAVFGGRMAGARG